MDEIEHFFIVLPVVRTYRCSLIWILITSFI